MNRYTNKLVLTFALMFGLFAGSSNAGVGVPTLINEILVNPNGGDSNCEFVEIIGTPSSPLTNIYFASIEGDGTSTVGAFDRVVDLSASTVGTNGLVVITSDAAGDCTRTYNTPTTTRVQVTNFSMENGTTSWALIFSPTTAIVEGTDYDLNDDGTLEALPADSTILDGIGWTDGGASDVTYGAFLGPTAFGAPDMATRFPGNMAASSAAAWYFGDMDGTNDSVMYDATQVSDNFPVGGMLTPGTTNVPAGGPMPTPQTDIDFDGDGISDYSIVRDQTPGARSGGMSRNSINYAAEKAKNPNLRSNRKAVAPTKSNFGAPAPGTNLVWYIANSSMANATFNIAAFGDASGFEQRTPADFDGDGKDDIAVWRPIAAAGPGGAFFFVINSSDSTVDTFDFGQLGDEAGIVGDYDGDGKADPAVFRQPGAAPFGATFFYYRGSAGNGDITVQQWGDNTTEDLRPVRGDYDGDGKLDFAIHRTSPTNLGKGQYAILRSSDGGIEFIEYGNTNDLIFPGDIDGDGMSDFIKVRVESGNLAWYVMTKDGSRVDAGPTNFGALLTGFSEFAAIADYDGDGKDDLAVYRTDDVDPNNCFFYVLRSSDGALQTYEFGSNGDVPVATWDQQF